MAELLLKSNRFRSEREADWRRLERLLAKAEGGRASRLSREELLEIPVLYRQALSGWMENDFRRAQSSLDELGQLGAASANISSR